jgi:hypothetical protein
VTPAPTVDQLTTNTPSKAPFNSQPTSPTGTGDDSRLIAYLGNWQGCPSTEQIAQYTHIVIAFAVSYTWSASKNVCSQACDIATPPVCNNADHAELIQEWRAQGKKVILSFGGAGMGGSWSGDVNDCWEYCFGREAQVVSRLTEIVNAMGIDGVDIDYEYFYQDSQNGSGFSRGQEAQTFLKEVTTGLRASLHTGAEITHAPMDPDAMPGSAYYDVLVEVASSLDFLMPQYYNGFTRPALDGIDGTGAGTVSALSHYRNLVDNMFGGDATKVVFGFCISDCTGTSSTATAAQASKVMTDLNTQYGCNGGAFFWVINDDTGGQWSSSVRNVIRPYEGCSNSPTTAISPAPASTPTTAPPSLTPMTLAPTLKPVMNAPTQGSVTATPTNLRAPPTASGCCSQDYKNCITWCGATQATCGECDPFTPYYWLVTSSSTDGCLARWESCTNDVSSCCPGLVCQFFYEGYSQCLPPTGDLLPGPTDPPASSPTPAPTQGSTEPPASVSTPEPVVSNPTTTPTSEPTFEPTTDCLPRGSKCRSKFDCCNNKCKFKKKKGKKKKNGKCR